MALVAGVPRRVYGSTGGCRSRQAEQRERSDQRAADVAGTVGVGAERGAGATEGQRHHASPAGARAADRPDWGDRSRWSCWAAGSTGTKRSAWAYRPERCGRSAWDAGACGGSRSVGRCRGVRQSRPERHAGPDGSAGSERCGRCFRCAGFARAVRAVWRYRPGPVRLGVDGPGTARRYALLRPGAAAVVAAVAVLLV